MNIEIILFGVIAFVLVLDFSRRKTFRMMLRELGMNNIKRRQFQLRTSTQAKYFDFYFTCYFI